MTIQTTFKKAIVLLLLTLIPTMIVNNIASGQGSNSCESEVSELLLSFQYPALDEVFVMGWYDYECDRFYLPVLEMFGHLDINRAVNRDEDKVLGSFLTDGKNYEINFHANEVIVGEQRRSYSPEMMKRGESDYYVSAEVFSDMFNMDFSLNISNLSVSLTSPHQMPVAAKESRIKARKNIEALSLKRSFYPLKYGRDRSLLSAGYIDYNMGIVSQPSTNGQDYNFQLEGGVEAFGGQLTGRNSFGHTSEGGWYRRNGNIRWRYDVRDVAAFSSLEVGQINTTGLMSQQINGVNVTNEPVEYLHFYGNSVVDGSTDANSEVELYLNNELVDFTISDAQGYYRFNVPLRYGSTRLRLKTYTPDGRLIENEKEIRIPFSFQRKGDLTYNLQAGILRQDGNLRANGDEKALNADLNYGVSNWLTISAGLEYSEIDSRQSTFYSSATARFFQRYLVNLDAAPSYFYRAQSSTIFNRDQSVSAAYTLFDGVSRFNQTGARQQFSGDIYSPLPFGFLNAGFRLSVDHTAFQEVDETRFQSDLFTQLGPFNVRMGYRDRLISSNKEYKLTGGTMTGSVTYRVQRNNLLNILSGSFIRSSLVYSRISGRVQQYDLQLSRGFFKSGQLMLGFSRILTTGQSYLQIGFNLDFKGRVRSSSRARTDFSTPSFMQTFRGSLGYDETFNAWQTSDRQQVGKAAVSILLFVDENGDGKYSSNEEIIPHPAVKLDRPAQMQLSREGVIRLSQLQSNYRYNLEVDRHAIPNPVLMPKDDKFSFIADPNQFKRIEIPFYPSGVIEGRVSIQSNEKTEHVGGLRLKIKGIGKPYTEEIRTFRDGSFYLLDIPPGRYELIMDPEQLGFLNVRPAEERYSFEINAKPEGDTIDNMDITLIPQ